ncbi:MAG: diacylglycerol kinase family lipid kinase [Bacteroidales bacterium]|nr:diacylglycerol kinase family lipid kinase [Bacteroidales bacterium]MBN2633866.1 diacylglycerol kinase family lipid kinase [Bacteroidales bacterium]
MGEVKPEKWIFIVNPIAGNGFAKTLVPEIERQINTRSLEADIVFTERPGHATELSAQSVEKGYRYIICVSGDGTMNEMARPLIDIKNVTVGIIPAGTGNDFIQILGFPHRFGEKEWDSFFGINTIAMDAGIVNEKIFLNGMGLGFDAQVAAENYSESGEVKKGGPHKYIWHIIKTLLFFREKRMKILSDNDHHVTDCFINTIANGRRFAGGFFLTPKAMANDGLLDVCSIKRLNLIQRFRLLLKVPKGEHILDKRVNYFQSPSIDIEFTEKVPFHVDGEISFADKFSVKVLPGALNIIYNKDGNHFFGN